ncbi:hypothetical protein WR25_10704 [Diploscapter pachys]|uniref:Uncharacterized protein n=1 Tax=Diploscapter pachys TaxID=2018661 RepID=A0A2A2KFG0_9BILA|nr:hypothetical protein WR25_10704 [Diploscapter pachys]
MPSMTLMISEISCEVRSMPPIASTARCTTSPERSASTRASRIAASARPARSAVDRTVAVISSIAAAVSSRDAACCSVRCDRSSEAWRMSLAPLLMPLADSVTCDRALRGREAAVQLAGEIAVGQGGQPGRQRLGRLRGGRGLVLLGPDDGVAEDVDRPRDVADLVLLIQMRHGGRAILCGQPADRSGQAFDRRDDLRRDDEQRHGKHRDSGEHQCDHDRAVRLRGDGGVGAGLLRDLQLQVDELADRVGHRIDGSIQRGDDEMVERGAIAAIQNRLEFGDALVRDAHARLRLVGQRGFVAGDAGGAIGLPMLMQGAQSGAHFCRRLGEAEIAVARLVRRIDDIDGIFVCDHLQIAHRHHPILQDRIERRLTVVHAPQRHACEQHDRHGEGCEARKELVADSHAILLRGPDKQHGRNRNKEQQYSTEHSDQAPAITAGAQIDDPSRKTVEHGDGDRDDRQDGGPHQGGLACATFAGNGCGGRGRHVRASRMKR